MKAAPFASFSAVLPLSASGAVRVFVTALQAVHVLLDCLLFRSCTRLGTHGMDTPGGRCGDISQVGERAVPAVRTGVVVEHGDDEVFHRHELPLRISRRFVKVTAVRPVASPAGKLAVAVAALVDIVRLSQLTVRVRLMPWAVEDHGRAAFVGTAATRQPLIWSAHSSATTSRRGCVTPLIESVSALFIVLWAVSGVILRVFAPSAHASPRAVKHRDSVVDFISPARETARWTGAGVVRLVRLVWHSALPHDSDYNPCDLHLCGRKGERWKPLITRLKAHLLPFGVVSLDCRVIPDLRDYQLAALGYLSPQHDDVVAVEDPFVVHRIANDPKDVMVAAARVEKVRGDSHARVVHGSELYHVCGTLSRGAL